MSRKGLLIISCSCLLVSVVIARGGPKLDLGPLSDDDNTNRTCADVMAVLDWISCEDDGSFSTLQCNPDIRRCFCVHPNGTRISQRVFKEKDASEDICTQNQPTCPEVLCQIACEEYKEDPRTGCRICECEDSRDDCPDADELAMQCSRDCMERDDDGCLECKEDCSGDEEDECDGEDCPRGGICVARGNFAARKCLLPEREDGQVCEGDEDDSEQDKTARSLLRGVASRRNIRNFRPAGVACQEDLLCLPYNATTRTCQRMDELDGPCFDERNGLECDDSGMFQPLQCSGDTCWCVDPENGTEIPSTRFNRRSARELPDCTSMAYESCIIVVRGDRYRVEHNRFGLDVSRCRRCLCQNGQLNDSTCVNGRSCIFITPGGGPQDCLIDGVQYRHRDVFQVDECNRCKCLNGRISGCTRRKCRRRGGDDDDDTPCDTCRDMPRDPVCGPNGITYDNLCIAQLCAGFDPIELTAGPCSVQDPCDNFPCDEGLKCVPRKITCSTRRGCTPDQYRMCINDTDVDCPVDDDNEVCGTDGTTYPSICRMVLESDDGIYAIYDGPCNQTECEDAPVCGTDSITYPSICVLRSESSNTRVDYEGSCLEPRIEETFEEYCERARSNRCASLTACNRVVQPTDGCCSICGGVVSIAIDEEALAQYAELFGEIQTLDGLLERIVASGTIPNAILNACEISAYITSTNNLEVLFEPIDAADASVCFAAADDLSDFINAQGGGAASELVPDPVLSFLTAGSSLEQETGSNRNNGAAQMLPATMMLLSVILAALLA